jgi:hypothetical protein
VRDYKNYATTAPSAPAFSKKEKRRIALEATVLVTAVVFGLITFVVLGMMMNTPAPQLPPVLAEGVAK